MLSPIFASTSDPVYAWGVIGILALLSGALVYTLWQNMQTVVARLENLELRFDKLTKHISTEMSRHRQETDSILTNHRVEFRADILGLKNKVEGPTN